LKDKFIFNDKNKEIKIKVFIDIRHDILDS